MTKETMMDPVKDMRHDHAELRTLASNILDNRGEAGGERDRQFKDFRDQVHLHLGVVEQVLLGKDAGVGYGRSRASGIKSEHKAIRTELKRLDRRDKQSNEWSAEFRNLTDHFERLCKRHETLMDQARARVSAERLERDYQEAKYRELNKSGMASTAFKTLAGLAGAAAVAGTAYAANRRFGLAERLRSLASGDDEFRLRLETDENLFLISSKKVEGTPVVDRDGARIGQIDSFMVDKYSGRVAYAVMRFGGTLGFGDSLFPLPWSVLDYEEGKGGYVLQISKERMADAPRFEARDEPEFSPEYRRTLVIFYDPAASGGVGRDDGMGAGGIGEDSPGRSAFSQFGDRADGKPGDGRQDDARKAETPGFGMRE